MPRKALDSDTESQKENQDIRSPMPRPRVKAERGTKVGRSSAKLNRVPSRVDTEDEQDDPPADNDENISSKQTRGGTLASGSGDEANDDAEGDDDEDDNENVSPSGRKRARINEAGDAMPVKMEEKVKVPRRAILPRDRDG